MDNSITILTDQPPSPKLSDPVLIPELADSGVSVADAQAATDAAHATSARPVDASADALMARVNTLEEKLGAALAILMPFHRDLAHLAEW
jgi:hypothetical protein